MQKIDRQSFALGLGSGLMILIVIVGGMRLTGGRTTDRSFGGGTMNITRMAQRFDMTEADLQKELDAGKTMQQIGQEHGVQFGGGRRSASATSQTGNGSSASVASSSTAQISSR